MRKIIALTHLTLDGIMQAPGGPEEDTRDGFAYGGWCMKFGDEVVGEAIGQIMAGEFDLLLGRRTYEIFAPYWPKAGDNPIANAFNKAAKYVPTNTLDRLDWATSRALRGDAAESVRQLKSTTGLDLHLWGSGHLLQTLIAANLVDEFRIWVYPVILGTGHRLFEKGIPARGLTLVDSKRGSKGVVYNTYQPGAVVAGQPIVGAES